jgi:predicted peroxiredoxin
VQRRLVVKIADESVDGERTRVGLLVAATAASSGVQVTLWLAAESVRLVVSSHRPNPADGTADLLATLREVAEVYVCARCAAERGIQQSDLQIPAAIGGAAQFIEQVLEPDVQALVY